MKNIIMLVHLIAGLFIVGCSEKVEQHLAPEDEIRIRLDRSIMLLSHSESVGGTNTYDFATETVKHVMTVSNSVDKVHFLDLYANKLMSIDLSKMRYSQQEHIMLFIVNVIWLNVVDGLFGCHAEMGRIYKVRFDILGWMQKQLIRIRPCQRIDPSNVMTVEESQKLVEWQNTYKKMYHNLKSYLYRLENEKWIIGDDLYLRPNARRDELKAKIEKWLGHPMRSEEELRKTRDIDTEDYKKVVSGKWAPDDIKN